MLRVHKDNVQDGIQPFRHPQSSRPQSTADAFVAFTALSSKAKSRKCHLFRLNRRYKIAHKRFPPCSLLLLRNLTCNRSHQFPVVHGAVALGEPPVRLLARGWDQRGISHEPMSEHRKLRMTGRFQSLPAVAVMDWVGFLLWANQYDHWNRELLGAFARFD